MWKQRKKYKERTAARNIKCDKWQNESSNDTSPVHCPRYTHVTGIRRAEFLVVDELRREELERQSPFIVGEAWKASSTLGFKRESSIALDSQKKDPDCCVRGTPPLERT